MNPEAIQAWTQLYAAVSLLAGICAGCALIRTVYDLRAGHVEMPKGKPLQRLLAIPKIWLHFQLRYLTGFPSILAIAILYAHYSGFAEFMPL